MTEKVQTGSFLGQPSDLSLFDFEDIGHFTVVSHDPGRENLEDYTKSLLRELRVNLVENECMTGLDQSSTVRRYDNGRVSIQPHIRGNDFEYIATPEKQTPLRRKAYTTYTISRLRFNEAAVTARIEKMRIGYDMYASIGNHDADVQAKMVKLEYEGLLHEVKAQFPDFVDPWIQGI